ncbi:MAG: alpha/beta-type small acid-soluble spore protein [Clostridia bacterium]|nr:alpha/beta-type small acid-soluble spore protein [Clostridia bacterium]
MAKKKNQSAKKSSGKSASSSKPSARKLSAAKQSLDRVKTEAASEVGVSLKKGYNGDLTAKQAGAVGGQMVKNMIDSYKKGN